MDSNIGKRRKKGMPPKKAMMAMMKDDMDWDDGKGYSKSKYKSKKRVARKYNATSRSK